MRCPSCGTQNEPDSRFCGGCGARVSGVETRLAPTEKIHSDAPIAVQPLGSIPPGAMQRRISAPPEMPAPLPAMPPGPPVPVAGMGAPGASVNPTPLPGARAQIAAMPASIPPTNGPTPSYAGTGAQHSVPPPTLPPGSPSVPPQNSAPSSPPSSPPARGSNRSEVPRRASSAEPDRSLATERPVARTRWGLIIVVLLLDAGLAAAGAWMLVQGLADADPVRSGSVERESEVRVADAGSGSATPATLAKTAPLEQPKPPTVIVDAAVAVAAVTVDASIDAPPPPIDAAEALVTKATTNPPPEIDAGIAPDAAVTIADDDREHGGKKQTGRTKGTKKKSDPKLGPLDPYADPLPPETK